MTKKKGYNSDKYKQDILKLLRKYPFMSTSEICGKLNMGYETGLKYIEQLSKAGKVKHRKIGNRWFWYL